MPLTLNDIPILSQFIFSVKRTTGEAVMPEAVQNHAGHKAEGAKQKPLPKGVVLGKDGKPYVGLFRYTTSAIPDP